ncbi:MAG: hypothetical protein ETSY1_29800 [Candidatus Entotheonella factor]|uniref:Polyketide cyclase n=1 Tax=Entotheonella factor TaxID=1429438 RepID=W4LE61_ENTF1|nr:SRPBCC family protein [Candidatus Entotheonella palauensis]ETW95626.1 MAG: hypothetical protein ETSY1_29800 [Candidatus Entotheonella factor]
MKLEHVIPISAPPEVVWAVTEDIERWPEWTPTVNTVKRLDEGRFDVGSTALLKQPGLPEATWRVTTLIPGEQLTWESRIRGMRLIATHQLVATTTGTQSKLSIEMSGLVVRLLWPLIRLSVRRSLQQENMGLKKQCEALHASS